LGLILWDDDLYSGTLQIFFEATINNGSGEITTAGLHDAAGNLVSGSEVTHNNATYTLVRSSAITLTDDTQFTVRIKGANSSNARIVGARLIIIQSDSRWITKTETHACIGHGGPLTANANYQVPQPFTQHEYSASQWDPAPTIYFEATLENDTPGETIYAALYTGNNPRCDATNQVSGSEISVTGTTWSRVRSGAITLTSGEDYYACYKTTVSAAKIANAKIIFVQSDPQGIASTASYHMFNLAQLINGTSTFVNADRKIVFTPSNFTGGVKANYFEAVLRRDTTGTVSAQIDDLVNGSLTNTLITSTTVGESGFHTKSGDITSYLPGTTTDLDVEYKDGTLQSSWLTHVMSDFNGTQNGTEPLRAKEEMCVAGKCFYFDGIDAALSIPPSASINQHQNLSNGFTHSFWVRVNSVGENGVGQIFNKGLNTYLRVATGSATLKGNLEAKVDLATTDATLTVTDGITFNQWHHIAFMYSASSNQINLYVDGEIKGASTDGSGSLATDTNFLLIGGPTNTNFHGFIDEYKVYSATRTATQVKSDFQYFAGAGGTGAAFGKSEITLSNHLIGYWNLDQNSGNAIDSSGNNRTLTNNSTTTFEGGKFNNGSKHVSASSQYFSSATTINGVKTVSLWAKPSASNGIFNLSSGINLIATAGTLTASGMSNPVIYINGQPSTSITLDIWQHITVVTDTAINADVFYLGRANNNYYNGIFDEVRLYQTSLSPIEVNQVYTYAPRPIAYWKFDESGGDAYDSSGNNITLFGVNDPVYSRGKFGNAIKLNPGSQQYYFTTHNNNLSISGDLSISAWVFPESATPSVQYNISGKWDNDDRSYLLVQYGDEIRMFIDDVDSYVTTNNANLVTGRWYHIQGVYRAAAQTVEIYVDGIKQTVTTSGTIPSSIGEDDGNFQIASQDSTLNSGSHYPKTVQSADDATENVGSTAVTLTGNFRMDSHTSSAQQYYGGVRWALEVPQGAVVTSAYFKGWVYGTSDDPEITIHAQATDSAAVFAASNTNISARSRTTNSVLWSATNLYDGGAAYYSSPDIKTVIQEVLDRPGWVSGNYLALITLPSTSQVKSFLVRGWDTSSTVDSIKVQAPLLEVNFNSTSTSNFYHGLIDDVKIYNYARSPEQILYDLSGEKPIPNDTPQFQFGSPSINQTAKGHWQFDEGSGTTAKDGTGNLNHLTLSSASWSAEGKYQSSFAGGAQVASRADDADFDFGTSTHFSVSAWVTKTDEADSVLVMKGEELTGPTEASWQIHYIGDSKTAALTITADTYNYYCLIRGSTNIADGNWHHITGVFKRSASCTASDLTLYVDGVPETMTVVYNSVNSYTNSNLDNNDPLTIGANYVNGAYDAHWNGKIDEVKIFNYALTTEQVAEDFAYSTFTQVMGSLSTASDGKTPDNSTTRAHCVPGDTSTCNPPVGYWKLDENTGTSAYDTSNNNKTGTLSNLSQWTTGKSGAALSFNGSSHYVDVGTGPSSVKTISFWVKPVTTTGYFINLTSTTDYIWSNSGTITATNLSSPTIYVNNVVTNTLSAGEWQFVTITTNTAENASNLDFGRTQDTNYFSGVIDDIKLYDYVRTPAQISWDMNRGTPIVWYKADECSGATLNNSAPAASGGSSGNSATLYPVSNGNTAVGTCSSGTSTDMWHNGTTGKYSASVDFDGNDDYAATANTALIAANTVTYTTASWGGWFKPATSPTSDTLIHKNNEFRLTTDGSAKPQCEIYSGSWQSAAVARQALTASAWSHLLCVYDGANITLYVNGVKDSSIPQTGAITSSSATNLSLARILAARVITTALLMMCGYMPTTLPPNWLSSSIPRQR
jgi:hypothetical protein